MSKSKKITAASMAIILAATLTGCTALNQREQECTVIDKHVRGDGGGYRVVTEQCGAFGVYDSVFADFRSAERYSAIEIGQTYAIKSGGFRNGFFSLFPNIIEATPIN